MAEKTTDEVNVRFGASIGEFQAKLRQATESVRGFGGTIKGELNRGVADGLSQIDGRLGSIASTITDRWGALPPAIKAVSAAFLGLGAAVVAGIGAKRAADAYAETVQGARDAARSLNVTTVEASLLRETLGDLGSSVQEYAQLQRALAARLKENEGELTRCGGTYRGYWSIETKEAQP